MDRTTFKQLLKQRRLCWGTGILETMTPHVVRTLARAGYDWLWLETEHAHHSYETIQEVVRTGDDVGVVTILRVAQTQYDLIARALDLGVGGIIVPRVETPEQARFIVDCAKYPPIGKRGFGLRPNVCGKKTMTMKERIEDQHNQRMLFIQVESRLAVKNLEAMLDAGRGWMDAVILGYADFQMDIGRPDTPDAPELDAAARTVARICAERNVSAGVPVPNAETARLWRDRGFNLFSLGAEDHFMAAAATQARDSVRSIA